MRLDLHMHSTASDGDLAPADVVRIALDGRLDVIALADHDTTAGVGEAVEAAEGHPIEVVPAIEMSSTRDGQDLHILGYFVDPDAPSLTAHRAHASSGRVERLLMMVDRLREQGVDVDVETVIEKAQEEGRNVGRPHLAKAMVEAGYVSSVQEAFDRYISDDHPAFLPTALQDPTGAIEGIVAAGGVAVWAHPPRDRVQALTPEFKAAGLGGLEVYRPSHSSAYTVELEELSARLGLLKTGGSDWHGPKDGELGGFYVGAEEVAAFLEVGGL